ncbi:GNAT family N-acetyltransferase [uncultured Anaerofustis sp.]|uniref:GNAT family N-acetyltransferase n=1 Tax=uncultured Anaerofustis sp. TaxID=904996 RepID=UPI0025E71E67|nr:GNAT family N-acetyltransferase [uncultured Anaerofustis sp.]
MNKLDFRFAKEKDTKLILSFIKELAVYENMLDDVVADEATLNKWLFEKKKAEVIIGEVNNEPIGFALFFHNFSTFLGKSGIYLEDLYIREEYRKKGYGKGFLKKLAGIAKERDCGRLEWSCLDWNKPSIDFYLSLGAEPMDEWTVYRLTRDKIDILAE